MIYTKRMKNGKKDIGFFYLYREHYQQRFEMELLLIVINSGSNYEPLLIADYQ
jgi:hypothetical protein